MTFLIVNDRINDRKRIADFQSSRVLIGKISPPPFFFNDIKDFANLTFILLVAVGFGGERKRGGGRGGEWMVAN